jgi:N-acetylglucosaminyldiphosphoundecaprenol N-acetyl-beta-D-mannosaminyltransferase
MLTPAVTGNVLSTQVDVTNHDLTCDRILTLARMRRSAYVCFATAHMLVEACRDASINAAYAGAAMVNPDGTPVAWCLRLLGYSSAQCVSGPRTMPLLLKAAEENGISVGFYGGRPRTLELMTAVLARMYPKLEISYCYSPPFRQLEHAEQLEQLQRISDSGTHLLFVGLGSPKQERWMHAFSPSLDCVCLGVGAAFEFMSGEKVLPPVWVQRMGLTWLVRLCQEPRRLAKRNLYSPVFAAMFLEQRFLGRIRRPRSGVPLSPADFDGRSAE